MADVPAVTVRHRKQLRYFVEGDSVILRLGKCRLGLGLGLEGLRVKVRVYEGDAVILRLGE